MDPGKPAGGDLGSPRISVVIPTFQRAGPVRRAVASVLDQSLEDFELIVVDDGSTDGTARAVEAFGDRRIRYVWQANAGRCAARNRGAALARAAHLTFLDSDDEALTDWLELIVEAFEDERTGIVCCGIEVVPDAPGQGKSVRLPESLGPMYENQQGLFLAGTFALQRDLFHRIGGYEERLDFSENTDLALRVVPHCVGRGLGIRCLKTPLVRYHKRRDPASPSLSRQKLAAVEMLLRRHGERLRDRAPRDYADYHAVAGVEAMRLARPRETRRHLWAAIRADPGRGRHYGRFALACVPPLARRFWLRHAGGSEGSR